MEKYHYEHVPIHDQLTPYVFHRSITINKNHNFLAHWHESIELLYFMSGECEVVTDLQHHHVKAGDVACVNSEEIHSLITETEATYDALLIPPAYLQKCGLPTDLRLQSAVSSPEVATLYRIIHREGHEKKAFFKTGQNAALNTLLVHLFRHYCQPANSALPRIKARYELIHRCIDYIHHNYLNDISTADISAELGITVNYLCSYFKKVTGTTIKKYINELRCHDAEVMLATGKFNVMEVGANCGFDNMAYFAKTYRSIIGVNPSITLSDALSKLSKENDGTRRRKSTKKSIDNEDVLLPDVFL